MMRFVIDGQKLKLLGDSYVVGNSYNYLTASFQFFSDPDWELVEKHVFFKLGTNIPYEVILVEDTITKDKRLNLSDGNWSIYIIGYVIENGSLIQRITTNKVDLLVRESGIPDGEPFPEVGGSIGEQILLSEQAREQGELDRNEAYALAESARNDLYRTVETDRNGLYEAAELSRDELYEMAEQNRDTAEGGRVSAEDLRNTAEQGRNTAEGLRISAEEARVIAEGLREETIADIEASIGTATDVLNSLNGDGVIVPTETLIANHNVAPDAHSILARKTETMRLLISRTIGAGENVSAITWTQDDAGNALALIDMILAVYVPANSLSVGSSGSILFRVNGTTGATDYYTPFSDADYFMRAGTYRSLRGLCLSELQVIGTKLSGFSSTYYSDGTTRGSNLYGNGSNFRASLITAIYIIQSGLTYFPEGTVIQIYGRTA